MDEGKTLDEMIDDILGEVSPKEMREMLGMPSRGHKRLSPADRDDIAHAVLIEGMTQASVAGKYGVTPTTVSKIVAKAKQKDSTASAAKSAIDEAAPTAEPATGEIRVAIKDAYVAVERLAMLAEHMSGQSWELLYALKRIWGDEI